MPLWSIWSQIKNLQSKHLIILTKHSSIDENIISTLFKSIQNITQITILNDITSIRECSFYSLDKLTRITILSSLISIWFSIFFSCSSLTQITLPQSVTSIGKYAFYSCNKLTQIITPLSLYRKYLQISLRTKIVTS